MGKNPAFQFYPNDWLGDPELQQSSATTRGVWANFLCHMWWARHRGVLQGTFEELCRLGGCTLDELHAFITENTRLNFADVTEGNKIVTVSNRRMVREEKSRESTRGRVQRFRNAHSNANVTPPSPSTPSPSPSPSTNTSTKTLVPVVDKSTPWTLTLDDVRTFLVEIQAPDCFFKESYWLRIDQWLGGESSGVYYFKELRAYLAWSAAQNGRHAHKDMLRGFRNWLSTTSRWKERDAQRRSIQEREHSHSRA